MIYQIKSYLKFLWKSTNAYGVHSPFVFDLVTKCLYDEKKYSEYSLLKSYRNSLLQNKNYIQITDFGAGSRIFKSDKRQISKIAETAGITKKNAELLFRMVNYFKPVNVLEIGTSLGLATASLSLGSKNATIITLEGCKQTSEIAESQFKKFALDRITLISTKFEKYLRSENLKLEKFDLIFIDGNHQKSATLEYFNLLLPTINNNSVWIFDDIYWSEEMQEAWQIIKSNENVSVTIDTYQWGIVFFHKEQKKEDFVIRTRKSIFMDTILGFKDGFGLIK